MGVGNSVAAMFGNGAVFFACLLLLAHHDGGTVSLVGASTGDWHSIDGYTSAAAHELQISHSPLVTFANAYGHHVCEGTLITPGHVLTAASCVDDSVTGFDPFHLFVIITAGEDSSPAAVGKGICPLYRK